jgi:hypothetical protein
MSRQEIISLFSFSKLISYSDLEALLINGRQSAQAGSPESSSPAK